MPTVQKWGNGLAVRQIEALADQIELAGGTEVTLGCSEGRMWMGPLARRRRARGKAWRLKSLLAGFKPEHRRGEVDRWGPVVRDRV